MNNRIMILAGGQWQVPLAKKAKELKYYVINSNLYSDSPAFKFADLSLVADVRDKDKNLEYARKYRPHAVITDQTDIAVPTVAHICWKLTLPGIGIEMAELFTSKHEMRKFCSLKGIPIPDYRLCCRLKEVKKFAQLTGYPLVVKPVDSQGSRGVIRVNNADELIPSFDQAVEYSRDSKVLVEEFVGGTELTVEGIKTQAGHRTLAISQKQHFCHNPMVACQIYYKSRDPEIDYDQLKKQHDSFINETGLPFGLTHCEYKYHKGTFYLIEMAARGGGSNISSHVVPLISGVPTNEFLISMALGQKIPAINSQITGLNVVVEFLDFKEGRVKEIHGTERVKSTPGIVDVKIMIKPGDVVKPAKDDTCRHGQVIACAKSASELNGLIEMIKNTIRVSYE